ncbi:hypothetical protein E4634_00865 [Mangrovimicrobium sediminis]|uniref:Uncharacterized protein n=1 Tax=Mangrovimicrobium sediminis TaxID=2562682 RepID=A0A4Z0M9C5_9GAMM|nr:hypothetical protein [Haliea sp. SAOS-164]TGD76131.1 hypothetical protein E4634_00865 [Haliea sp. SAOS-164]
MLDHLNKHWKYTDLVVKTMNLLIEDGIVDVERAQVMQSLLGEPRRLTASLKQLEEEEFNLVSLTLAEDCIRIYQELALHGHPGKGDYLEAASRALLVEGFSEHQARAAVAEILERVRREFPD